MKNSALKIIYSLFFFFFISINSQGQAIPTPTHMVWEANGEKISLKRAHAGISAPSTLTFDVYFSEEDAKKLAKNKISLEFKWYYYYSTTKEYMDSYTVNYDNSKTDGFMQTKISSTRKDISPGWWEVQLIIVDSDKKIAFNKMTQFQVFIQ